MNHNIFKAIILVCLAGLCSGCVFFRQYQTTIKQGRDRIEYWNDSTGRHLYFIGTIHIGQPKYYAAIRRTLDSLRSEGYVVFWEGLGRRSTMDSLIADTIYRKFRKLTGFYLTNHLDDENKSMRTRNKKRFQHQSNEILGIGIDDEDCFHADYCYEELIAAYEAERGEVVLTDYDWQTPLLAKYDPPKEERIFRSQRLFLIKKLRNRNLVEIVTNSPYQKMAIVYGVSHMYNTVAAIRDSLGLNENDFHLKKKNRQKQKKQELQRNEE